MERAESPRTRSRGIDHRLFFGLTLRDEESTFSPSFSFARISCDCILFPNPPQRRPVRAAYGRDRKIVLGFERGVAHIVLRLIEHDRHQRRRVDCDHSANPAVAVEEVLGARGARSGRRLGGGGGPHGAKQRPAGFPVRRRFDGRKTHGGMGVPGQG
jgi:hypothetical protein